MSQQVTHGLLYFKIMHGDPYQRINITLHNHHRYTATEKRKIGWWEKSASDSIMIIKCCWDTTTYCAVLHRYQRMHTWWHGKPKVLDLGYIILIMEMNLQKIKTSEHLSLGWFGGEPRVFQQHGDGKIEILMHNCDLDITFYTLANTPTGKQ